MMMRYKELLLMMSYKELLLPIAVVGIAPHQYSGVPHLQ